MITPANWHVRSKHNCRIAVFETIYKFTVVQNLHKTDNVAGVWFCY